MRPAERLDAPSEAITFTAHDASCPHCGGPVKMPRDPQTMELQPTECRCLFCAQRYHVVLDTETIGEWEARQWREKGAVWSGYPLTWGDEG